MEALHFCCRFPIYCCVFKRERLKFEWCFKRHQFRTACPSLWKLGDGWARSLYQLLKLHLRPNLWNTLDSNLLRGCWAADRTTKHGASWRLVDHRFVPPAQKVALRRFQNHGSPFTWEKVDVLHIRLTELYAAHQNLPPAIRTPSKENHTKYTPKWTKSDNMIRT